MFLTFCSMFPRTLEGMLVNLFRQNAERWWEKTQQQQQHKKIKEKSEVRTLAIYFKIKAIFHVVSLSLIF